MMDETNNNIVLETGDKLKVEPTKVVPSVSEIDPVSGKYTCKEIKDYGSWSSTETYFFNTENEANTKIQELKSL